MILDATSGLREMWFNKNHEDTVYLDIRNGPLQWYDTAPKGKEQNYKNQWHNGKITPDIQADNTRLPFRDEVFDLVLYDPPHEIGRGSSGIYNTLYTQLGPFSWIKSLYDGSRECFRVLKKGGFLVFKWSERSRVVKRALSLFPQSPLFGTNVGSHKNKTWWLVFKKGDD